MTAAALAGLLGAAVGHLLPPHDVQGGVTLTLQQQQQHRQQQQKEGEKKVTALLLRA
jgi:hypothetical protein